MRKSKVDGVGYTLDGVKLSIADLNMLQSQRPCLQVELAVYLASFDNLGSRMMPF